MDLFSDDLLFMTMPYMKDQFRSLNSLAGTESMHYECYYYYFRKSEIMLTLVNHSEIL